MLNEIMLWIVGLVAAFLGGGFLFEKRKATKAEKAQQKAEEERDTALLQVSLEQAASQVKDDLAQKKEQLAKERKEVIQTISQIPKDKEEPLSNEVKKLSADQAARSAARARSRADRVQDD